MSDTPEPSGIHHFTLKRADGTVEDLGILDEMKISTLDGMMIQVESGKLGHPMTVAQMMQGLNDMDAYAMVTLVWLLRRKAGRPQDIFTVEFNFADLSSEDVPGNPTTASSGESELATSEPSPDFSI